ncbi:uncharacterized protein METZ01_LOCUS415599, partial [marine metagenome]
MGVEPISTVGRPLTVHNTQTTTWSDEFMPKQLYNLEELTPEWRELREKTIAFCKTKNHSDSSIGNAERISICVASNMMSLGISEP